MPGSSLMCVWEAAHALDMGSDTPRPLIAILRELTLRFANLPEASIYATGAEFDKKHPGPEMTFDEYYQCVRSNLLDKAQPFAKFIHEIELLCWEQCQASYTKKTILDKYGDADMVFRLWQMFNRLSIEGSFPPVMMKSEVVWFIERLVAEVPGVINSPVDMEKCTFREFITRLTSWTLQGASKETIIKCITGAHDWLVEEILQVGWLNKRTRKTGNWTNWQKRWCVLTPGSLDYYDGPSLNTQKGSITVNSKSTLSKTDKRNSFSSKKQHRVRLGNPPFVEIDLASKESGVISKWYDNLREVRDAATMGSTPVSMLLSQMISHDTETGRKAQRELTSRVAHAKLIAKKSLMATEQVKTKNGTDDSYGSSYNGELHRVSEGSIDSVASDEEFDNDMVRAQKDRLHAVFMRLDVNGDGFIDFSEFCNITKQCGLNMDDQINRKIFDSIDVDKNDKIDFEELNDYFMSVVMNDVSLNGPQQSLKTALMRAGTIDGQATLDFKEFTKLAAKRKQSIRMSKLLKAFDHLDAKDSGEVKMSDFKRYMSTNGLAGGRHRGTRDYGNDLNKYLKDVYDDTDMEDLAKYIRKRWDTFASFKRYGADDTLVMTGGHGMVRDVVPGKYSLVDLAFFNDLAPLEPKKVVIQNVKWISAKQNEKSGKIIFPPTFSGKIPTEFATSELLRYYECTLADVNQEKISLVFRHGIQDFTYENRYLEDYVTSSAMLGGAGLEKHEFSHLDCPIDEDSGNFILAKFEDGNLHVTAFKVPQRHTLYIPPNVIHCNDYLKGTWRTMLSDEAHIDHVQLVKPNIANPNTMDKFTFRF